MINKCINPRNVNYVIGLDGKYKLFFSKKYDPSEKYFTLKCNRCLYCQQIYSNNWAVRLMLESKLHKESCFITLTYNNNNLPLNNSLKKRDTQLFIKRLRKKVSPLKVRYYLAGEYGGRKGRPHYHMVLFGYVPKDLEYLKKTKKDEIIYTSKTISKLWKNGFISVGVNMTLNSLKYVAKYLSKMSNYDPVKQSPPFSTMSNRPGIGRDMFDISVYETDGIYLAGRKWSVPKYFDRIAEENGYDLTAIKKQRDLKVKSYANTFPTLFEKIEYKNYVERQGYDLDHLFMPSARSVKLSYIMVNNVTGEIDLSKTKNEIDNFIDFNKHYFLETRSNFIPKNIAVTLPWYYDTKQLNIFSDLNDFEKNNIWEIKSKKIV